MNSFSHDEILKMVDFKLNILFNIHFEYLNSL